MIIGSSQVAVSFLRAHLINLEVEELWCLALDSQCQLIGYKMIFRGSLNFCLVSPREIFRFGFLQNATYLILAHNHPSGVVLPSEEDCLWTKKIQSLGKAIEMPIVDHLILADHDYFSFAKS